MPDIAGNVTTTSVIAVGNSLSDTLEVNGDHDWIRVDLVAGQKVTITLNGVTLTPLVWEPYRVDVSACLQVGRNELRIEVANTNANAFEGRERPSGLLGPVWIVSSDVSIGGANVPAATSVRGQQ